MGPVLYIMVLNLENSTLFEFIGALVWPIDSNVFKEAQFA